MGISLSGLTESSTGNLTISAGSGNDVLIGNGSTQIFIDGGTDTLGIGGTAVSGSRLNLETGAVALDFITSTGTALNVVADTVNDTSGAATLAIVPTVQIGVMTYTSTNSMTYTDTASLYIAGIPAASTNVTFTNAAYALWVDAGAVRFDDRTFWIGGIAYEFPADNGNANEMLLTDGSGNLSWSSVASASAATTVTVTDNEDTNESNLITFVAGAASTTGNYGLEMDGDFHYSPNTGTVTATNFSGNLTGTLQTAAQATITSVGTLTDLTVSGTSTTIGTVTSGIWNAGAVTSSGAVTGASLVADLTTLDGNTLSTSSGNLTLSAATGADVLIGDNETILYIDGGVAGVGIGTAPADHTSLHIYDSGSNSSNLLRLENNDASGTAAPYWDFRHNDDGQFVIWRGTSSTFMNFSPTGYVGIGTASAGNQLLRVGGTHTNTTANGVALGLFPAITTVTGSTSWSHARFNASVTTYAASNVYTNISTLMLDEPAITLGSGSSATVAATLTINDAPTEATNNYALFVDSGVSRFDGGLVIADGGNIGSTSDTDAISISSGGVVTMNQIPVFSAGINVSGGTIAGTLATASQTAITGVGTITTGVWNAGAVTSSGAITGASLVADLTTIDSNSITTSSGNFTLSAYDAVVIKAGTNGNVQIQNENGQNLLDVEGNTAGGGRTWFTMNSSSTQTLTGASDVYNMLKLSGHQVNYNVSGTPYTGIQAHLDIGELNVQRTAGGTVVIEKMAGIAVTAPSSGEATTTLTDSAAIWVRNATAATYAGTNTTQYGIYIEDITAGNTDYAIYTAGTAQSVFLGKVGIGGATSATKQVNITSALETGDSNMLYATRSYTDATDNSIQGVRIYQERGISNDAFTGSSYGLMIDNKIEDGNRYGWTRTSGALVGVGVTLASGGVNATGTLASAFGYSSYMTMAAYGSDVAVTDYKAFRDAGLGNGSATNGYGFYAGTSGGTITNRYGFYVKEATGTITNQYGLKIENLTQGGTLNYSIHTGTAQSHFGGDVLIGPSSAGLDTSTRLQIEVDDLTNINLPLFLRNDGSGSTMAGTGAGIQFQIGDANAGPSGVGSIYAYNTVETFDDVDQYVAIRAGNATPTTSNGHLVVKANGTVGIGTNAPLQNLVVAAANAKLQLLDTASGTVGIYFADATTSTGSYQGYLTFEHASSVNRFKFGVGDEILGYWSTTGLGIGGVVPAELLHIKEQSGANAVIRFDDTDGTALAYVGVARTDDEIATGTGNTDLVIRGYGTGNIRFSDGTRLRMLIAGSDGDVSGTHGDYHVASDERLKKDIVTIPNALTKVLALRGVNFKWKDERKGTDLKMGLIAQEVEAVIPEVVHTQDTDTAIRAVEYQYITGLLIEAVKELKVEIDVLKSFSKGGE